MMRRQARLAFGISLTLAAGLLVGTAHGQAPPPAAPAVSANAAPDAWLPAIQRAQHGFERLHETLRARLEAAMQAGGPVAAVRVCRDEAQRMTARLGEELHLTMGRTSHAVRNRANVPRAWAAPLVAQAAGTRAAEHGPMAVDLGDRLGVLAPIPTGDVCVLCHGPADTMAPPVAAAIRAAYPSDRATGFLPGDLRGWMWAEVAR